MKVGIVGATGAVGLQMMQCLQEQHLPIDELRLFASERSVGKTFQFDEKDIAVELVNRERLSDLDVVFGAVSNDLAKEIAPMVQETGGLFIDNSSAFRLEKDVPLVVPEINGEDAKNHHGIISNPNCSTIITLMAVAPIHRLSPIQKMVVSTYQAVSGAGVGGMKELTSQMNALGKSEEITPSVFPKQIAYNVIPMIGSFLEDGYTSEEMKMEREGRKILHNEEMMVSCTCVRVPVMRSHSISVSLSCKDRVTPQEALKQMKQMEGLHVCEDTFPTPLESSFQDTVLVGRIREDRVFDGGLSLWCCGDQIRKGAASNAIGILKCSL